MKKRILSIVLTLCMVLMLLPQAVFAANDDATDLQNKLNSGGTVTLSRDYTIDTTLKVTKTVALDLNGHVIRMTGSGSVIKVGSGGNLTMTDSNKTATHTDSTLPAGGVITGSNQGQGGGVYIYDGGSMTLNNGTIQDCSAKYGGGVFVTYGSFTMTGGAINNCSANNGGGGVCVSVEGSMTLNGGTIANCSAEYGGGVHVRIGDFTMTGGTIANCSAEYGGGVCINNGSGSFNLTGGTITNCKATGSESFGGGSAVSLNPYSDMTISGNAIISDCPGKSTIWCAGNIYAHGGTINGDVFIGAPGNQYETVEGVGLITKKDDYTGSASTTFNGNISNWGATITYGTFNGEVSNVEVCRKTMKIKGGNFYGPVTGYGPIYGGIFHDSVDDTLDIADGTKKITFMDGDKCYAFEIVANGSNAVAPIDPVKDGYKFMDWYNGSTKYDFTQPVTKDITLTAKWVWSNISTEAGLKEAIDAGITSIKLIDDITLLSALDLSDKDITLDLNGHILKGNIKLLDSFKGTNPSKLTLIDGNPTATHTNSNLPLGGVLDGKITLDKKLRGSSSLLYANGGTVTGQVILNDSATQIVCTSTTPTAFLGDVVGIGAIHGGMFYGDVTESCIEEKIVRFLSDGQHYARGVVKSGKFAVAPIDPVKDGYVFAGWYIGNTKYNFAQPVMLDVVLNAKWVNEVTDEATLRTAINEGITTIKLMADINLSRALDLSQKNITIDLNGYVISGADISINTGNGKARLTLRDSRPTATHTDSTLPSGGVVTSKISMKQDGGGYNDCVLYANGGTVTSEFNTNTNAVAIKCTSNTPTAFTGKISGYAHLYGGIYYGTVNSSVTFEESKITFKNGDSNYAYEVLSSDKKSFVPISPSVMTGYQAFDGWYNGNTKYTFGSSLSQDITLTAKYKNPLTYNITYNLGGGTVTNPTSYTVESDAITLNNPVKTGYTFTGWSGTGLTGENNMTVTIPKVSTGNRAYTAHFSQNSYTVAFNTVGGSSISDKTGVKWTDQVLDGITAPTKDGFEFIGWKCGDMTVNANTKYSDLAANDTVTSVTLVAQWKDIAGPTGEISIGTNKWNSFLNTITFGLFFKDTQTVTITASDNSGDAVKIEYLLSDKAFSETELVSATFTSYTDSFSINPDNEYIVYARLTDQTGNVAYLSSNGIVLDASAPVISGIENGKTYCEAQTVTVTEEYIESVTVNGTAVTLDENNQFTLNPAEGTQTIVVTDKAGNVSAEMTVTVNAGHTYEWQSENGKYWKKCKFCGDETAKKDIPTITIDGADVVCVTQDYKFSFTLPQGATDTVYGYEFENKGDDGLPAIIENNEPHGVVSLEWYEPSENSFKVYAGAKTADGFEFFVSKTVALMSEHTDAAPKDHICDICGATLSEHSGGEATCVSKAVCEYCGEEYGELDSTNHNLEKIPAKDATVTATGNKEYWHCKDCGKYFADENGTNEIKLADTVIAKLPPEIIEGKRQSVTEGAKKELTFKSNAAFSDFIRAQLDGKTLDEKNYTVKEGSTVVTLKADYVATLSAGEHTIGIVSVSGTATTAFIVNAKAVADNDTKSPQTGDNNHITFWIALFAVSCGLLTVTGIYSRKKKHSEN